VPLFAVCDNDGKPKHYIRSPLLFAGAGGGALNIAFPLGFRRRLRCIDLPSPVRGFRECTAALYGNYDKRDPYGYEILDDCLNNLRTNHEHAVRVGFADYELKKNLFARKAVNATAATHGLLMEPGAPAVSFRSKACCGGEQTMLSAYTLIVVLFFLAPMLYFTGQLCWGKKKKHLPMIRSKEAMLRRIDVMFKHRS